MIFLTSLISNFFHSLYFCRQNFNFLTSLLMHLWVLCQIFKPEVRLIIKNSKKNVENMWSVVRKFLTPDKTWERLFSKKLLFFQSIIHFINDKKLDTIIWNYVWMAVVLEKHQIQRRSRSEDSSNELWNLSHSQRLIMRWANEFRKGSYSLRNWRSWSLTNWTNLWDQIRKLARKRLEIKQIQAKYFFFRMMMRFI